MRFQILSTGFHAPPRVETCEDLAPRIGRSPGWIASRTGVLRRRVSDEPMEVMAARAARAALGDGPPPDLVVNASLTPAQLIPDSSAFVLRELGLEGIASFSVHATCLSFLVGLVCAGSLVVQGPWRRALVVSSEVGTVSRNMREPESAALIGDGAGAAVVEPSPAGGRSELLAVDLGTWPEGARLAELRGGGTRRHPNDPRTRPEDNLFHMDGPALYKLTYRRFAEFFARLLARAGTTTEDIDLVVPHQPSKPALDALARFGFPPDKVVNIVAEYGNCIAASMPMALAIAVEQGRLSRGQVVLLLGAGAGLGIGGGLLRW